MGTSYETKINTMIKVAELLSESGRQIQTSLKSAYDYLGNLGTSRLWVGNQYDKVVDSLNNNLDTLNSLIKQAGTDIPNALAIAAQNYAAGDGISVRSANLNYIPNLEIVLKAAHMTGEIIYKDDEIDSAVESFSNEFKKVSSTINGYQHIFTEICTNDWVGAAMEQYKAGVQGFATTAASISAEINTAIINGVREAQEALKGAENNTEAIAAQVNAN